MKCIVEREIATAHNAELESMKIKTMDPNEHNTQRIENEAIKTNRTGKHFWDVLVFDVAFLFWVLSIFGSSLFLRLSKKNVGSFSFLR